MEVWYDTADTGDIAELARGGAKVRGIAYRLQLHLRKRVLGLLGLANSRRRPTGESGS